MFVLKVKPKKIHTPSFHHLSFGTQIIFVDETACTESFAIVATKIAND